MKVKRINYLDAIRGIAVWLVVLYHAYARYEHFPYGFEYASFPLLKYGYLGVELFFLISGFVILMTLERSRSFINFLYKRWLRLFPAMAIVTLLFYVGYYLFCEKWIPYYNLLPGLTFTEPYFYKKLLHINTIKALSPSFWTLFVEVKFYAIFGGVFFLLRKNVHKSILFLVILWCFSIITSLVCHNEFVMKIAELFIYYGWFAGGCYAYLYFKTQINKYLYLSGGITLVAIILSALSKEYFVEYFITVITIIAVFFIPLVFEKVRFVFQNKFLLFFGFISYSFYLLQEPILLFFIDKIHTAAGGVINSFCIPLPLFIAITGLSYGVTKAEIWIRKLIKF